MNWEDFMRSVKCHHENDDQSLNVKEAMEKRIRTIKEFQKAMPPKKVIIDEDIMKEWIAILNKFDNALKDAQGELVEIRKRLYR